MTTRTWTRQLTMAALFVLGMTLAPLAQANLFVYEGFDYDNDGSNDNLEGQNGGGGWGGAWSTGIARDDIFSGSFNHPGVVTTGNRINVLRGTADRTLANTLTVGTGGQFSELWVSAFIGTQSTSRDAMLRLRNGSGTEINILTNDGVPSLSFQDSSLPASTATRFNLIKLEETVNGVLASMWINPDVDGTDGSALDLDNLDGVDDGVATPTHTRLFTSSLFTIDNIRLEYSSTQNNEGRFDEIRIGDSLTSVVQDTQVVDPNSIGGAAVPEPTTALLIALGLGGMSLRRRRA